MAVSLMRTVVLYLVVIIALRLMGKRQIGDMEPTELVITFMISELAAIPMQDISKPLLSGLLPILMLVGLQLILSCGLIKSSFLWRLFEGKSSILVKEGKISEPELRRNRMTVTELLEGLRAKGFIDVAAVKYAILETNGQLSVLPFEMEKPPTAQQWISAGGTLTADSIQEGGYPKTIIKDGRVEQKALVQMGLDMNWVLKECRARGAGQPRDVFLMTRDELGRVYFLKKGRCS